MNPQRQLSHKFVFAALVVLFMSGCGGSSQEDLIMRAARRPRPPEESAQDIGSAQPTVENSETAARPAMSALAAPSAPEPPLPAASGDASASDEPPAATNDNALAAGHLTLDRRRPNVPLSEFERRKRSAENLKRIGDALTAYIAEKGRLPLPASKTASGVATLSWRVELLPYLGYEGLHRQFDLSQPWDSPKNRPLLDLIPDCYVSPERFDSSTNYLGISGRTYLFNGDPISLRKIEDGLENTLAVVEVDDRCAVPWTSPTDYAPQHGNLRVGLGNLRPEGIYALWANGRSTLVAADIGEQQLHRAFTYESGDSLVAGDIHNALVIQEVSEVSSSAAPTSTADMVSASTAASDADSAVMNRNRSNAAAQPRLSVPKLVDLTTATAQVQDLYEDRLKAAVTVAQRRTIAQEMLTAAADMREDPAGAYALQTTAVRIAAAIGDLETACQAIDAQVAMFDVDSLERSGEMLTLFGRSSLSAGAVDGRAYLQRALPVLHAAIKNNAYDLAKDICQSAIQFETQARDRMLLPSLNRLRLQITAADNQHHRVEAALAQLRKDPSNPAANSTVGLYLAFIKGDWQRGLSLLAEGNDDRLAQIAATDSATGSSAPAMLSTADRWWELGEATAQKKFRGVCRGRAAYWYAKAMQTTPESLARMHAEARLRDAETRGANTPLDSVAQLADALGVDLQEPSAIPQVPTR